ncbi:MAG: phytochrome sensor protein, partial [Rubrivivax sp. SCN 70-15]
MTLMAERRLAHADLLRARGVALSPDGLPPAEILDSWARCQQAGLDFAAPAPLVVVGAAELARRREQTAVARRLAQAELETLAQQIAGSDFLLAFADRDGVILDCYADNRFAAGSGDAAIVVGRNWSESLCGTNGLGTALALGRPTSVSGPDHYFLGLGDLSCCAAPVRDARGEVVGVLDASSHFDSRQRHTQALVQMAATHVENGLLLHQMREHLVLAMHPRPEFLRTLSAGLLAFDAAGALVALNARASQMLQGLAPSPGSSFDTLFGEPFSGLLARLQLGTDLRLRDRLGSVLSARCVSHPTAPAAASPARAPADGGAARAGESLRWAVDPTPLTADPTVAEACRMVEAAVRLKAPILIQGETGTGKELLARHAHRASGRRGAFVAVNCGALPAELFEAELFGYVGGSFTGARREGSVGLIASADGGTLLLDEVRELPLRLQAALLRFL